jgi:ornithine decarboxylase
MSTAMHGKIASSASAAGSFVTDRDVVDARETDFTDVSAVVLSADDIRDGYRAKVEATRFHLPVFAVLDPHSAGLEKFDGLTGVLQEGESNTEFFGKQIETAAAKFDLDVLPPFFGALMRYERTGYSAFDCPGHQGGQFFRRHQAGRRFFDFFGENLFRADLCNADVDMGDLLIHEGAPAAAEAHAAKVYNADRTYFVLNGTSMSNKVVTSALVAPGDLVLFDRNNHKSIHHGALIWPVACRSIWRRPATRSA